MAILLELRKAIEASGKSYNQIATETGIAHPIISRFMSGSRGISGESAEKLAVFFGLELKPAEGKAKKR